MGLLGDLTQFGGISLFKKAMKKKKAPSALEQQHRAPVGPTPVIDPLAPIETGVSSDFSEGFAAKAQIERDDHRRNRKHSY